MKKIAIICALAGAATFAMPASAQDRSADPISGTLELPAAFQPDPRTVDLIAGGSVDASRLGGDCRGNISDSPDVRVVYEAGSGLPLVFTVASDADTTLVINAPDGRWYCNDDKALLNLNPRVIFRNARAGSYEVWVGKIGNGNGTSQLRVSEVIRD
jgi:hypothetical protein